MKQLFLTITSILPMFVFNTMQSNEQDLSMKLEKARKNIRELHLEIDGDDKKFFAALNDAYTIVLEALKSNENLGLFVIGKNFALLTHLSATNQDLQNAALWLNKELEKKLATSNQYGQFKFIVGSILPTEMKNMVTNLFLPQQP